MLVRDPYGVRPLFIGITENNEFVFVLKLNLFQSFVKIFNVFLLVVILIYKQILLILIIDVIIIIILTLIMIDEDTIKLNIRKLFIKAVNKRLMSDRPIGCLLSGGLDSSLVSALVARNYEPYTLNTFSIGMKGSTDLYYANLAAKHIKSNHHNIELTNDDFLNAIEETIYMIESYDITTVTSISW